MCRGINRAAATAFGRLSEMREVYEGLMTRPRERRARVERELRTALSETNAKSNAAHSANQAFASRPDGRLTTADFDGDSSSAIARAKLEAALQFIVPYINADDRATAERQGVIEGALNPMRDCLPCQMDGAFQLLDMRMDHLAVAGPKAVRATRDGALKLASDGRVTTSDGLPLQGGWQPIPAGTEQINISPNGTVTTKGSAGTQTFQIQLVRFANPAGLDAAGRNLFKETGASGTPEIGNAGENGFGELQQGYLEMSNVKVVEEMVNMILAQRAYEVNSKAVQTADEMMQLSNNLRR
jgi:flagellar basal body rod protein FlgF